MKISLLASLALLSACAHAFAGNYKAFPPKQAVECQVAEFHVYSADELVLTNPPAHPDFVWLEPKVEAEEKTDAAGHPQTLQHGVFRGIPLRTGAMDVPTLPAVIGGEKVLLRYDRIEVAANPLPASTLRMATLWNGEATPPKSAVVGEAFDLDILLFAPKGERGIWEVGNRFGPELAISSVRWQLMPALPYSDKPSYFYPFDGRRLYAETTTTENGVDFLVRRFKTRFTVGEGTTLEGVLTATAEVGKQQRSVFQKVAIPIQSLPPAPRGEFIDSGLIGQWTFTATTEPAKPVAGQPFTLRIDIDGAGGRHQCADLDFAGPGFKSLGKTLTDREDSRFDHWRARFEQRLLATGQGAEFPAIALGNFDPRQGRWIKQQVLAATPVAGATAQAAALDLATTADAGPAVSRPVWLNFPPALLLVAALAPMLPFAAGLLRKQWDKRDPQRAALRRQRAELIRQLEKSEGAETASLLDQQGLAVLRAHLGLSDAASPGEIAAQLGRDVACQELATVLREHHARRFSGGASALDGRKLASLFARLSFLVVLTGLTCLGAHAMTPAECDAAARSGQWESAAKGYEELIQQDPGRPAYFLNLAKVLTQAGRLQEARAACHTALLLEPANPAARALHANVLRQLNAAPEFRAWYLRPDQILVAAAVLWILGWLLLALHRLRVLKVRWPASVALVAALIIAGLGGLRSFAYAPGQYFVISENDRALPAGKIVRGTPAEDPAFIAAETPEGGTRLIPAKHLRAVW